MRIIMIQIALVVMNVFLAGLFIGIGQGYLAVILIPCALFSMGPIFTEIGFLRDGHETYPPKKERA